jgi:hypothetical protein
VDALRDALQRCIAILAIACCCGRQIQRPIDNFESGTLPKSKTGFQFIYSNTVMLLLGQNLGNGLFGL